MSTHVRLGRAQCRRALVGMLGGFSAGLGAGCGDQPPDMPVLTAELPLHLEDQLGAAIVQGSALPALVPLPLEWQFDQPQPDWVATPAFNPPYGTAELQPTGEALRITLTEATDVGTFLRGGMHVRLPEQDRSEWAEVVIRARADSASAVELMGLGFNLREPSRTATPVRPAFQEGGPQTPIVRDGTVQTYRLRLKTWTSSEGPITELCIYFGSDGEPGSVEILSVSL
ncbi:MAG TPA: hypothetical protein VM198_03990, partial [Longimicrobiales bacterium]|nr:hypothetical protein [Longimicrobiales bacterium]